MSSVPMTMTLDPASLPNLASIRDRLPDLKHVVGVAGAADLHRVRIDELCADPEQGG